MLSTKVSKVSKLAYPVFVKGSVLLIDFFVEVVQQGSTYELANVRFNINTQNEGLVLYLYQRLNSIAQHKFNELVREALIADLKPELYSLYYNGTITD